MAYVFRHEELGLLGRLALQTFANDNTHVSLEIAGDPADLMTAKRAAIFKPLAAELTRCLEARGGSMDVPPGAAPPVSPPPSQELVKSKLMQCERCGAGAAAQCAHVCDWASTGHRSAHGAASGYAEDLAGAGAHAAPAAGGIQCHHCPPGQDTLPLTWVEVARYVTVYNKSMPLSNAERQWRYRARCRARQPLCFPNTHRLYIAPMVTHATLTCAVWAGGDLMPLRALPPPLLPAPVRLHA